MRTERYEYKIEPFQLDISPYSLFVGSIRSPVTKEKYLQRMGYFFDYLNIHQKDVEERFDILTRKADTNTSWLVNAIFNYLQVHKGRVERKEISTATLRNYVKPIRLYCEQMDIPVPWKKLMRGMPKGRRYANDRAPKLDEIRRVLAYPDRRIRPIVCVMTSSGIRLSAWNYLKWKHIVPLLRHGRIVAAKILVYAGDNGIIRLAAALARTQEKIQRIVDEGGQSLPGGYESIIIPDSNKWMTKMLHFAVDTPNYKEVKTCMTWKDSVGVLSREYNIKKEAKLRKEIQGYPNINFGEFQKRFVNDSRSDRESRLLDP